MAPPMCSLPALQPPPQDSAQRPIASVLHTVLLIVILLAFSAASARSQHDIALRHGRTSFYLATMVWEWILFGYVLWGIRRRQVTLAGITGGRWSVPEDALLDVAIAFGFWLAALLVLGLVSVALGLTDKSQVADAQRRLSFLIPQTRQENIVWILLSLTAGFCEEIIFRGYLLRQFRAWTGSMPVAVLLQALVFGLSHGYEGSRRMAVIVVYGTLFGLLVWWRRSLRPGMMSHALHDSVVGLVYRFMK